MGDRELLELAAGVAGLRDFEWGIVEEGKVLAPNSEAYHRDNYGIRWRWNPLEDDGDALRLAVRLKMEIDISNTGIAVRVPSGLKVIVDLRENSDPAAVTRMAIVRAAAQTKEGPT